jgi:hypothetical protein
MSRYPEAGTATFATLKNRALGFCALLKAIGYVI